MQSSSQLTEGIRDNATIAQEAFTEHPQIVMARRDSAGAGSQAGDGMQCSSQLTDGIPGGRLGGYVGHSGSVISHATSRQHERFSVVVALA